MKCTKDRQQRNGADDATPNDLFRKAKNPCVARTARRGGGKRRNGQKKQRETGGLKSWRENEGSNNDEGDSSREEEDESAEEEGDESDGEEERGDRWRTNERFVSQSKEKQNDKGAMAKRTNDRQQDGRPTYVTVAVVRRRTKVFAGFAAAAVAAHCFLIFIIER